MSEQWHYAQKGESYIKVDTLHKIRTLETELAAVTEQRDRLAEALQKNLLTTWIDEIEFEVFKEAIAALKEEADDR